MDDRPSSPAEGTDGAHRNALDIYPLNCYFFGSKDAVTFKDETLADRVGRMKLNYDTYGLRTCVQAVLLVELFKHPHLLLLQVRNSIYKLPGGRVRPGESDIDCLKRKLTSKLSMEGHGSWEECTKLYLVRLPASCKFIVPKNFNLLAIPLCQIHENRKTYGPIISGVPQLLSKFSINVVEP
ncbi:PREDICTED: pre-mRNA cleavage factor Im 25 kDa subunit 1 isoform X2 [Ipomoea nil]|uniref:pre-mRNA cleavage factor Im 25 kDa subunit 1 isoform X2 n=1 Tax=Ipomoea nil TaxID=35883 RepID=UPI0009017150|nr:PREDICTED: pre-mRNA cleavage factor Im 25 kDa subunit 1 isoform X2 [Ipomoea nil]